MKKFELCFDNGYKALKNRDIFIAIMMDQSKLTGPL
jgi:hypothetical protein